MGERVWGGKYWEGSRSRYLHLVITRNRSWSPLSLFADSFVCKWKLILTGFTHFKRNKQIAIFKRFAQIYCTREQSLRIRLDECRIKILRGRDIVAADQPEGILLSSVHFQVDWIREGKWFCKKNTVDWSSYTRNGNVDFATELTTWGVCEGSMRLTRRRPECFGDFRR
jgi:hypothetical protein